MIFEIYEYELTFEKMEFYFVTDLRLGEYIVDLDFGHTFLLCVFPKVKATDSIKLKDFINIFKTYLHELSEEDVVRVFLLYLLEMGFKCSMFGYLVSL